MFLKSDIKILQKQNCKTNCDLITVTNDSISLSAPKGLIKEPYFLCESNTDAKLSLCNIIILFFYI